MTQHPYPIGFPDDYDPDEDRPTKVVLSRGYTYRNGKTWGALEAPPGGHESALVPAYEIDRDTEGQPSATGRRAMLTAGQCNESFRAMEVVDSYKSSETR